MAKDKTPNGKIVKAKQDPYTLVANKPIDDTDLSLRAKGLYTLIKRYITMPGINLNKDFLICKSSEGKAAFETAWQELIKNGYLKVHKESKGRGEFYYVYELDPEEKPSDKQEEKEAPGSNKNTGKKKDDTKSTKPEEKYPIAALEKLYGYEKGEERGAYDAMFESIINLIHETLNTKKETLKIGKDDISAEVVRSTLLQLTKDDIYFVIDNYQKTDGIYNPDAWLLTALYRAKRHRKMSDVSADAQAERDFKKDFGSITREERIAWVQSRMLVGQ